MGRVRGQGRVSRPTWLCQQSLAQTVGNEERKTDDDHADEARDEAWELVEPEDDVEGAREVDECREGIMGDDLRGDGEGRVSTRREWWLWTRAGEGERLASWSAHMVASCSTWSGRRKSLRSGASGVVYGLCWLE